MNRYSNDAGWLRVDPALKLAMRARGPSSDPDLASQPRLPRTRSRGICGGCRMRWSIKVLRYLMSGLRGESTCSPVAIFSPRLSVRSKKSAVAL